MECPFEKPVEKRRQPEEGDFYKIIDNQRKLIACGLNEDEADYIVQAINSHKKLVDALKKYGRHSTPEICCEASIKEGGRCICGLEQALKEADKK